MKAIEREKINEEARQKLLHKIEQMNLKHQREIYGIKKKHESQRETLYKQRAKEFDIIEQRYINVWNDLDAKYKKGLIYMDKISAVKKMQIKANARASAVF